MKKVLMVLGVLFLFLIAAGVFLILRLDVDQYRPQITAQLEKTLGKPVKLEKITLGWHSGLALSFDGLAIAKNRQSSDDLIRIASAKAELNLTALLTRQIQISTIYLGQPQIHIVKKYGGEIDGLESPEQEVKPGGGLSSGGGAGEAAAGLSLLIGEIKVDDGEVFFRDETANPPMEITVRDLDLKLKNITLNQPIDIDGKAAVLSRHQNLKISGSLKISPQDGVNTLSNFHAETELDTLDFGELSRLFPAIQKEDSRQQIAGRLSLDINSLKLDPAGLKTLIAEIHLAQGRVLWPSLKEPVENLNVDIFAETGEIKLKRFSARFAGGEIEGRGAVNLKTPKPLTSLNLNLKEIYLEQLLEAPADPGSPQLKGILSGKFEGTMAGMDQPSLSRTLTGDGHITLERGVIMNLNVLKEVFRKLSMIPGLADQLKERLPENYEERLNVKDTQLEPVELPLLVKEGTLILNRMDVRTQDFALQGAGSVGLEQQVFGAQMALLIEPELSKALIRSVEELQSLSDRNGSLQIPLNVQGKLPHISVVPDLQYIASKLAVAKAQDVLSDFFKKPENAPQVDPATGQPIPQEPTAQQAAVGETAPAKKKFPKGSQILGQLLESALRPESETGASAGSQENSGSTNPFF